MRVLEMLRSRSRERHNTAAETLLAAANRLAADESVDHAAVERALVDAGQDVDAFEALCDLAKRRREWRATFDRRATADMKLAKATMAAEREREAFEATAAAWRMRGAELDEEIRIHTAVVSAADTARERLVLPENVPAPLGAKLAAAIAERDAAAERVGTATRELRAARELHKQQTEWASHKKEFNLSTPGGDAADHERRANRAARRAAELLEELKAAQSAEEEAANNVRSLEAAALKM